MDTGGQEAAGSNPVAPTIIIKQVTTGVYRARGFLLPMENIAYFAQKVCVSHLGETKLRNNV
jgi:hypothetical protein